MTKTQTENAITDAARLLRRAAKKADQLAALMPIDPADDPTEEIRTRKADILADLHAAISHIECLVTD